MEMRIEQPMWDITSLEKVYLSLNSLLKKNLVYPQSAEKPFPGIPLFFYLGSIISLTAIFTWGLLEKAYSDGIGSWHTLGPGLSPAFMYKLSCNSPCKLAGHTLCQPDSIAAARLLKGDSA